MNRHAPDDLLLSAARVVEMAEKIDQKKRDRLLFRLAREALRAEEVIASMGYQIMMLENHLRSARASAEHWEGVAHTLQPQSYAADDAGSHVSHTTGASLLRSPEKVIAGEVPAACRPNKPMDFRSYEKAQEAAKRDSKGDQSSPPGDGGEVK